MSQALKPAQAPALAPTRAPALVLDAGAAVGEVRWDSALGAWSVYVVGPSGRAVGQRYAESYAHAVALLRALVVTAATGQPLARGRTGHNARAVPAAGAWQGSRPPVPGRRGA